MSLWSRYATVGTMLYLQPFMNALTWLALLWSSMQMSWAQQLLAMLLKAATARSSLAGLFSTACLSLAALVA